MRFRPLQAPLERPQHLRSANCPLKKSSLTFFPLENLRFSRVLRTRDRLLLSGRQFIHGLLSGEKGAPRPKVCHLFNRRPTRPAIDTAGSRRNNTIHRN